MTRRLASLAGAALMMRLSTAPAVETTAATDCAAIGNLVPYCGLPHPEEIEVLPDGSGVIASDMHIAMTASGMAGQPGSDSPQPNGVQVDASGRYAYINTAAGGGEVRKLDLLGGEVVAAVSVLGPDNAVWTPDGRLLITGMVPDATNHASCFANPGAPCPVAFNVFAIEPATMHAEHLFTHSGSLGGGTVAVQFGTDLLIGSCFGDRITAVQHFFKHGSSVARGASAPKQEAMP